MDVNKAHLLEGDGVLTNLFFFLWKLKSGGSASKAIADLCVPSTVVLEHNFPKAWYFNAEGDPRDLERKLGRDVDTHLIYKDFADGFSARDADTGDIVASYYSSVEVDGEPSTRVEFLDDDGLQDLLLRRTRRPDGFLQKWVPCSSKHNTVIQAVWSPHLCVVRKRQNRVAMRDRRRTAFDRAVTYEGPTYLSDEVFVAPHVNHQVEAICNALVQSLYTSQRLAVQRMVLHFKVDANSSIWLLSCTSMRVADRIQLNLAPRYVRHGSEEVSEVDEDRNALRTRLQNEGYEKEGAATSRIVSRRGNARPSHPLNVMHPKPPSMGPIGDMYNDTPLWTARQRQLAKLKSASASSDSRPLTARPRPQKPPEPATGAFPKPPVPRQPAPKRRAKSQRKRRPGPSSSGKSELDSIFAQAATARRSADAERSPQRSSPIAKLHARLRWIVLKVAVISGTIRLFARTTEVRDWGSTFLYTLYSHFTCSTGPIKLVVHPFVTNNLQRDWAQSIGLTAGPTDDEGFKTVLACGVPLMRLQRQLDHLLSSTLETQHSLRQDVLKLLLHQAAKHAARKAAAAEDASSL